MPKLRIDNQEVEVAAGATILDAAQKLGIEIPTLCYLKGCEAQTSCLVCVVKVNGGQRLVPACATKAVEGMSVESETADVHAARRTALELLIADHAGDCFAPCQNVCPAHMDIPGMMRLIAEGRLREAIVLVKETISLPAILGRICPDLCENGCRRGAQDEAVSICESKRFVADADLKSGAPYLPICKAATGKRVAIVGAGPAGLAAAWYLLQAGHGCVILDEHAEAGGNLRYAIGEEQLPRAVIDAEVGLIVRLGAQMRMGTKVGRDVSVAELQREFDAVLLAVGEVDQAKASALGMAMAGKGLKGDRQKMTTDLPGVFVAGGAMTPTQHAVRAVGDGRDAARMIDQYLKGETIVGRAPAFTIRLGTLTDMELVTYMTGADPHSRTVAAGGGVKGFDFKEATIESRRCLGCDCVKLDSCRLRQLAVQYQASPVKYKGTRRVFDRIVTQANVVFEPGKCIACGLCVEITSRQKEPLGLAFIGRGFDVRIGVPFNDSMERAMMKTAGECVAACPTGAISFRNSRCGGCGEKRTEC